MNKIAIIEDDRPIAELLAYILKKEGFEISIALTGSEGLELIREKNPALILLDWSLPDISGIFICKHVTQSSKIPIIMLTAKNLIEDKLLGLEMGADDYITKPFDVREVVARVKATFRRLESQASIRVQPAESVIVFDGLTIDQKAMSVTRGEEKIELTPLEFSLLLYLYSNRNIVLSRNQILDAVWGYQFDGGTRTIDIHILRLRQKLQLQDHIQTVFKVGYKFI